MSPDQFSRPRSLLKYIGPMALLCLTLSACTIKAVVGLDVAEDGSGVANVTVAYDEELRELIESESPEPIDWTDPASFNDMSEGTFDESLFEDATVSPYEEGDFIGFTASREFASVEELNAFLQESTEADGGGYPLNLTSSDGTFQLTSGDFSEVFGGEMLEGADTEMIPTGMLETLFDIQIQANLPGEIVETNADETTDDGTMVWRINPLADSIVSPAATTEVGGGAAGWIWGALAVVVLAVTAVVVWTVVRRNGDTDPPLETTLEVSPVDAPVGEPPAEPDAHPDAGPVDV